jgi:acetyltransferase-like isoleucine patch superfamily enzyme
MLHHRIINTFYARIFRVLSKPFFKSFGTKSSIVFPLQILGTKNISIGSNVYIAYKAYLAAVPLTGEKTCSLEIGNGTSLGNFNHIFATKKITIGKNVLTADKVYISDNLHGYEDILIPIVHQSIKQVDIVEIGDGTWIGEHVCIIGAKIGRNCVIGANSVVRREIPDYCVAVGSPAKIIKRFNIENNIWEKTNPDGSFIIIEG